MDKPATTSTSSVKPPKVRPSFARKVVIWNFIGDLWRCGGRADASEVTEGKPLKPLRLHASRLESMA
jgi:hypothetical protein